MNIREIALKVLGLVKKVKGDTVNLSDLNIGQRPTMNHDDWDSLLKKHVSKSGKVNYQGFIKDRVDLQNYLNDLSGHPPGENWLENEKLAYWINAYNAFTVKLIVDNYPLKSIREISDGLPMINSTWDIKFFKINNVDFDLNTIEHEVLRKQFNEPRIHFAINCASVSCPKLRNEAYFSNSLNTQLEEQAFGFINSDKNIINEQETKLSKIFDWFRSDFVKEVELEDYLKKYKPLLKKENKVEYLEYDWSLNS